MVKPLLYERATSSCSFRIRLALNIAGIEYVHVSVTTVEGKGPEYRMKNPQGLVPLLVVGEDYLSQVFRFLRPCTHTESHTFDDTSQNYS